MTALHWVLLRVFWVPRGVADYISKTNVHLACRTMAEQLLHASQKQCCLKFDSSANSFVLLLCSYHVLLVAGLLRILLWLLVCHTRQFECLQAVLSLFSILLEIKKLKAKVKGDS